MHVQTDWRKKGSQYGEPIVRTTSQSQLKCDGPMAGWELLVVPSSTLPNTEGLKILAVKMISLTLNGLKRTYFAQRTPFVTRLQDW